MTLQESQIRAYCFILYLSTHPLSIHPLNICSSFICHPSSIHPLTIDLSFIHISICPNISSSSMHLYPSSHLFVHHSSSYPCTHLYIYYLAIHHPLIHLLTHSSTHPPTHNASIYSFTTYPFTYSSIQPLIPPTHLSLHPPIQHLSITHPSFIHPSSY